MRYHFRNSLLAELAAIARRYLVRMLLPALDAFTGADGTALTTYSASWTLNNGDFWIQTNAVASHTGGVDTLAHWNADVFQDNQYAQGLVTVGAADWIGVACRVHVSAATGYGVYFQNSPAGQFFRMNAGSWTQFGSDVPIASGSVIKIRADGQDITVTDDGVDIATANDATISSGSPGICGNGSGTDGRVDNWEGNDLLPLDADVIGRVQRSSLPPNVRYP